VRERERQRERQRDREKERGGETEPATPERLALPSGGGIPLEPRIRLLVDVTV